MNYLNEIEYTIYKKFSFKTFLLGQIKMFVPYFLFLNVKFKETVRPI